MSGRRCKVLILDWNEDTLISLQHVLETGGVDTTITWDEAEARTLIKNRSFDLLVVADHPPELCAETILRDFKSNMISCPCLLLRAKALSPEQYSQLGISEVFPERDPFLVLDAVRKHWQAKQCDIGPAVTAGGPCAAANHFETQSQAAYLKPPDWYHPIVGELCGRKMR
jgi:CheY-like chemotaxis protein